MKKAYISFSFDDGRIDNYTIAYPILKKHQLPATFNITTGFVEGKFEKGALTYADPMTVDMVKGIYQDSTMEIAGHGYWHKNTFEDILQGKKELERHLEINDKSIISGFASPGTGLNRNYYFAHKDELTSEGIQYVRLSLRYLSHPQIKTFIRKVSRVLPFPFLYKWAYLDTLMDSIEDDLIYSVPVLSSISISQLRSLIKGAIRRKKICVLMFHSIVEDGDIRDHWDYERSKFEELCRYLAEAQQKGLLEVVTSKKAYQLLKEEK